MSDVNVVNDGYIPVEEVDACFKDVQKLYVSITEDNLELGNNRAIYQVSKLFHKYFDKYNIGKLDKTR